MNKKSLGKCYDALINDKKIEIKTSSLGIGQSFQHELDVQIYVIYRYRIKLYLYNFI